MQEYLFCVTTGILKKFLSTRDYSGEDKANASGVDFCLLMDVFMTEARGLMATWLVGCMAFSMFVDESSVLWLSFAVGHRVGHFPLTQLLPV